MTQKTDPIATGATARPNRVSDGMLPSDQRTPARWFDTSAFSTVTCVCFGNPGRNILWAPGFVNIDLSLVRDFPVRTHALPVPRRGIQLFNHPNLGLPGSSLGARTPLATRSTVTSFY